jgi:predicted nucleic acid-binding protein
MFIIDTNILASEILVKYEQDELTLKYRAFFQEIPLMKRVVPDFILNEFELLMTQVVPSRYKDQMTGEERKELRVITSAYIERIIGDYTLVSPTPAVIKKALGMYKRFENTHYISFTDSLLLATAQENRYTVITKDRRVNDRAKELQISFYELQKENL